MDLRQGLRAESLDLAERKVTLSDGSEVGYERLLLATGARAKLPEFEGHDLPGVLTLRDVEDSIALRDRFYVGQEVVTIGAGYIGVEGSAAALDRGASVTVVDPGEMPWGKFASRRTGAYVRSFLEGKGARFLFGDEVTRVERDGERLRVTLKSGATLPADTVLVGVGAAQNTEIAKDAGLDMDEKHGVCADPMLRTSDERVWVAGDIAAFEDLNVGRRWHAEHYLNAKWQGARAGANMARDRAGETPEPYDRVPYFFSDILETHMILRGDPAVKASRLVGDPGVGRVHRALGARGRHARDGPRDLGGRGAARPARGRGGAPHPRARAGGRGDVPVADPAPQRGGLARGLRTMWSGYWSSRA